MTENERVKILRKTRDLTLEQFGIKIGLGKSAISDIENGRRPLTRQNRLAICREFRVREEWLRDGTGPMEDGEAGDELRRVLADHGLPEEAYTFLSEYIELTEPERAAVLRYIRAVAARLNASGNVAGMTREQYHAELERQLDAEEKAGAASSAS